MTLLKSPVFVICCILFIAHQAFQLFFDWPMPLIHSFLDNLLAMPIILTLILFERRYLFKWKGYYRLSILEITLATLFVGLVAEILFPALSDDFTSDWRDIIFLSLGAVLFYFSINPKK